MQGVTRSRKPLVLIAVPAAIAVWSGWVGLGKLCGFGVVQPFPGVPVLDRFTLNTAITLPIGMEAYGAYALKHAIAEGTPQRARQFAAASAIGSLLLGCLAQVVYHLLSAYGVTRAPWPVIVVVSCVCVGVLGLGASLYHLLGTDAESERFTTEELSEAVVPDNPESSEDVRECPESEPDNSLTSEDEQPELSEEDRLRELATTLSVRKLQAHLGLPSKWQAEQLKKKYAPSLNGQAA